MNDLTEQWNKGKLPTGLYWINTGKSIYPTQLGWWHTTFVDEDGKEVNIEVLDKCDHEELQALKTERDKFAYDLGVADATNWALLRLLKECKFAIDEYRESLLDDTSDFAKGRVKEIQELLTKIEKVTK